MPGLVGIIGTGSRETNEAALQQMLGSMGHEPFYSSSACVNSPLGLWLGWTGIKGSFHESMPIWNGEKNICLIFLGEAYIGADEIDHRLASPHGISSDSLNSLVRLYEERGPAFLEKLNGRFSGIIVDLRGPFVLLFNDRYGLSRIYYHEKKDGFYFSSEAKALLRVLPELRQVDYRSLAENHSMGCVLGNRTLFKGVSLLPVASLWRFSPGNEIKKGSFFSPKSWEDQEPLGCEEYYQKLKETWSRVLPQYLRKKGRIALSLTGGKDSRMILAWAGAEAGSLPCYTFGGMYRECHDVKLARRVAETCHQPHHVIPLDRAFLSDFPRLAEKTISAADGTMDVSGSPELYLNNLCRQIAPIRITGNYGQDILRSAVAFRPRSLCPEAYDGAFTTMINDAARSYHDELGGHRLSFVAFKQIPWYHYSRQAVEASQITLLSPFLDNELVALAYRVPPQIATDISLQLRLIAEGNPALSKIDTDRGRQLKSAPVIGEFKHKFQELTFKAEYAYDYGMPQGLARLDHLVRPLHMERLFLGRHKFYHFRVWYRDALSGYVKEILLDPRTMRRSFLNARYVERIVKSHISGTGNYTTDIHRLLTTELIFRQFIDHQVCANVCSQLSDNSFRIVA